MAEEDPPPRPPGDFLARLRAAALDAELRTGEREDTEQKAARHILARIAIVVVGSLVLLAGLIMLLLPGPGIVAVLAGLGILAQELPWAERMLSKVKEKTNVDKVRSQPAWVQAAMLAATVAGVGASIFYAVAR